MNVADTSPFVSQTYFSGESYAGQYIPYFGPSLSPLLPNPPPRSTAPCQRLTFARPLPADAVLKSPLLPAFPLRGIAIGNGWIDPREQYQGYVDFAYSHKLIEKGTPVKASLLRLIDVGALSC